MGQAMDYSGFAETYAETRRARDWLVAPLCADVRQLPASSRILDIGCGTGNYTRALQERYPQHEYHGFDISREMLRFAERQAPGAYFSAGNADKHFPYADSLFAFAFVIDVIHHLSDYSAFFAECARVIRADAVLAIVTDADEDVERRSLTRFFPETVELDGQRYPGIASLGQHAEEAGLHLVSTERAEGTTPIDATLVDQLGRKCSSSLRLLSDARHARGMARVKEVMERKECWLSSYTVLRYVNKAGVPMRDAQD